MKRDRRLGLVLTLLAALTAVSTSKARSAGSVRGVVSGLQIAVESGCSTDTTLCLGAGRFLVDATWTKPDGESGIAHAVVLTPDSGYFWFLEPDNVELAVKTLNGCSVNQHYWFFSGGLTNLEVEIRVSDTTTNQVKTYSNPQGQAFQPVTDTKAFSSCPAGPQALGNPEEPPEDYSVAMPRSSQSTGGPTPTSTPHIEPAPTPTPIAQIVVGPGPAFSPASLTVHVGDTVQWIWANDTSAHSTTSGTCAPAGWCPIGNSCTPNGIWDSGLHSPPFSFSRTFRQAGTFPYFDQTAYQQPCRFGPTFRHATGGVIAAVDTADQLKTYPGEPLGGFSFAIPALEQTPPLPQGCESTDTVLCIDGRFTVEASWQTPSGRSGTARAVTLTSESGYFWFFDPSNVEVIAKTLNACGIGKGNWFFAAGMTTVGVHVQVTDTFTGGIRIYDNAVGVPFVPIQDTAAFPFCPTETPTPTQTETSTPTLTPTPTPTPTRTPRPTATRTPGPPTINSVQHNGSTIEVQGTNLGGCSSAWRTTAISVRLSRPSCVHSQVLPATCLSGDDTSVQLEGPFANVFPCPPPSGVGHSVCVTRSDGQSTCHSYVY